MAALRSGYNCQALGFRHFAGLYNMANTYGINGNRLLGENMLTGFD